MKKLQMKIAFEMEFADRSVGIMAEGFVAWEESGTAWSNLVDISPPKGSKRSDQFEWFDNETGDAVQPPTNAAYIEQALLAFALAHYGDEDGAEAKAMDLDRRCPRCGVHIDDHPLDDCGDAPEVFPFEDDGESPVCARTVTEAMRRSGG